MAGDWIKVEKETARKPEVLRIADILGIHPDHAFGLCVRFWFWCDDQLVDGHAPRVTNVTLNSVVGHAGFAEALAEVGWLNGESSTLVVPKFDRHLSQSAKNRVLTRERKRKQRVPDVTKESRSERGINVTRARGESERESLSLNSDREANGSATAGQSLRRSPRKFQRQDGALKPDLSEVDLSHVSVMAEAVGKRIPAMNDNDRRMWFRAAVLAELTFSEAWLAGAADSVVNAKETKKTKQAHFVGVLKAMAADSGFDSDTFTAMLGAIEIPDDVWKSSVLEIRK